MMIPRDLTSVVSGLVATVLSLTPAEVLPGSSFFQDLGAESIDLLDLRFRLEEALGLKLSGNELSEACGPGLTASEFRAAFTVEALARFVATRLEAAR